MSDSACECLNECGDDPEIYEGVVRPCSRFVDRQRSRENRVVLDRRAVAEAVDVLDRYRPFADAEFGTAVQMLKNQVGLTDG